MKTKCRKAQAALLGAMMALVISLAGCQSVNPTQLSPLDARLEPVPGGGVRYFVLINNSGHDLHNFSFSSYLWNENDPQVFRRNKPFRRATASGPNWAAGKALRFRTMDKSIEDPIYQPITKVGVVGHCDEGHFCQYWLNTESGQLQAVVAR